MKEIYNFVLHINLEGIFDKYKLNTFFENLRHIILLNEYFPKSSLNIFLYGNAVICIKIYRMISSIIERLKRSLVAKYILPLI